MDHLKNVYLIQKQLKKDAIVSAASRLVKDAAHDPKTNMSEVGSRFVDELNKLLFELDQIDGHLANISINQQ